MSAAGVRLRALLVGEPVTGTVAAIPGVALLPALVATSRSPAAPLLSFIRRTFCWARAVLICCDADLIVGIAPPRWARHAIDRRRAHLHLRPATWMPDAAAAHELVAGMAPGIAT